eukprot:COSAG03_NODE_29_length_18724_cov_58.310497_11_plen_234_part_00
MNHPNEIHQSNQEVNRLTLIRLDLSKLRSQSLRDAARQPAVWACARSIDHPAGARPSSPTHHTPCSKGPPDRLWVDPLLTDSTDVCMTIHPAFAFRHTPIQTIPTHFQTDRAKLHGGRRPRCRCRCRTIHRALPQLRAGGRTVPGTGGWSASGRSRPTPQARWRAWPPTQARTNRSASPPRQASSAPASMGATGAGGRRGRRATSKAWPAVQEAHPCSSLVRQTCVCGRPRRE